MPRLLIRTCNFGHYAKGSRRIILGTMTEKEMALQIAEFIISLQMREIAVNGILERFEAQGQELLSLAEVGHEELLSQPAYLQRIDQMRTAFDAAKSDEPLIRILHRELLFGYKIP